MTLNKCPDFKGKFLCGYFISTGACGKEPKKKDRYPCPAFQETGKRPIEDDIPLALGKALREFPDSSVVTVHTTLSKEAKAFMKSSAITEKKDNKKKMEDVFGKLSF
jgi:hypothetical protein